MPRRPRARAAHGYCPTCVALHGGRDAAYALTVAVPAQHGGLDVLACPNCGREWMATRGGFKRAHAEQAGLPL